MGWRKTYFERPIRDHGRGAEGCEFFKFWRGVEWVALVELQVVGNAELFAEPDDALGLRDLEVVDCEHCQVG